MNSSSSIVELAKALVQAQAEMPFAPMNTENKFIGNKYADLGAVIETSRPILTKYGLSISQFPTSSDGKIGVRSVLLHSSGQWMEDTIYVEPKETKGQTFVQTAGVVITYLRRYSWAAIIGMYADQDNDGELPEKEKAASKKKVATPTGVKIQKLWDEASKETREAFKVLFVKYEPEKGNPNRIDDEGKQKELLSEMKLLVPETKKQEDVK